MSAERNLIMNQQRGYFGIGIEGASKPMNFGNLARTAYGFGASFTFTLSPAANFSPPSDTTKSNKHMPFYNYESLDDFQLPANCKLVGVEFLDTAENLPEFHHPKQAAYILGPEGGSLSPQVQQACSFIVKIPCRFCLNVATAGAILMYDRMLAMGRFAPRPLHLGTKAQKLPTPKHGKRLYSGNKISTNKNVKN